MEDEEGGRRPQGPLSLPPPPLLGGTEKGASGRDRAFGIRILEPGAEREVRRGRAAPTVAQLTAAKPQRWGDLYANRSSPGGDSANINMDSPRDRFNQFM